MRTTSRRVWRSAWQTCCRRMPHWLAISPAAFRLRWYAKEPTTRHRLARNCSGISPGPAGNATSATSCSAAVAKRSARTTGPRRTLTASGKPAANNGIWHARRRCVPRICRPRFRLIGAGAPARLAVAIGRNKFIAWAFTPPTSRIFVEHVDPSGTTVEYQGGQEPNKVVPETIVAAGALSIGLARVICHGPLPSRRDQRRQRRVVDRAEAA